MDLSYDYDYDSWSEKHIEGSVWLTEDRKRIDSNDALFPDEESLYSFVRWLTVTDREFYSEDIIELQTQIRLRVVAREIKAEPIEFVKDTFETGSFIGNVRYLWTILTRNIV